ncbi:photosynthetic complex assembly protein [Methylobacterium indicum]|uniref:Photosynthetic complex assembly protein n=1 Tax=Methylobacterium indicum TaxID=1775910 RepID=A0ABR5HF70_9HYPH|nr:photosynthetic complex assembly protein PuhC [Methylobacterium indicum]KMO21446.1 photosynthetic complex assembly protein [Methylobacterium indicum]KMO25114.1 photosynthetic complex assembly protein [Methylobacterium indicum]KTS38724.1 photosynthetic complex assembly protein [Methylobacterium indicum]KTS38955.1 photosynthetic complex assembly protein [Methylobacterium indicum]KTS54941.1 photosynthetic complex assembly protein [Methylobacterium indicum]
MAHDIPVPRPLLRNAGLLVAFSLAAVAIGRFGGVGITQMPPALAVQVLDLAVEDRPDGRVDLRNAANGRLVAEVQPGEDGFLRATLRVMAQGRLREGLSRNPPFRLTRWDNGTLTLDDVASGRRINLEAFGLDNAVAFARLLEQGRGAS